MKPCSRKPDIYHDAGGSKMTEPYGHDADLDELVRLRQQVMELEIERDMWMLSAIGSMREA